MKTLSIALFASGLLGLGLFVKVRSSAPLHAPAPADVAASALLRPGKSVASGRPAPAPAQAELPQRPLGAGLSDDEEAVLGMYEDMALQFERFRGDCTQMADAALSRVAAHEAELARLRAGAEQRSAAEAGQMEERLAALAGPRMERFRNAANHAVQGCSQELMPVFRRLAGAGMQGAR